jgi:hypothetical protein
MYLQEKFGRIRNVGYAVGVVVIIVVTLWRLMPRFH